MVRKTLVIHLFSFLFLGIFLASCVPQAGSKKSDLCTSRTSFDTKTQKCTPSSTAPGGTLDSIELFEDSGDSLVSLTYHDSNNDLATQCRVVKNSNDFEIFSPQVASVKFAAQNIYTQAIIVDAAITGPGVAASNSFLSLANLNLQSAFLETNQTDLYNSLVTYSSYIKFVGVESTKVTSDQTIFNNGLNLIAQMDSIANDILSINQRCYCSNGICQAIIRPGDNISGLYEFSYSVNDNIDGSSSSKLVQLDIIPVNDPPVALDMYIAGNESENEVATSVDFTVANARDVENDLSLLFNYEVVLGPTLGVVTNCALDGSGGTDLTCSYTPFDGDGLGTGLVSSRVIGNILFESYARDVSKNSITVEILTKTTTGAGVDIVVNASAVKIYIVDGSTSAAEIINAVNADLNATGFLKASIDNVVNNSVAQNITLFTHGLNSGADSYDSLTYRVHDGQTYSTYSATISFGLTPQNDAPIARESDTTPLTLLEDTITKITLGYFDAENDTPTSCAISNLQNLIITKSCDCLSTPGFCNVYVRGSDDYYGAASFSYLINNVAAESTNIETVNLTISSIVDIPYAKTLNVDTFESSTSIADEINFIITDAHNAENAVSLSYTLLSAPALGSLRDCMGISGAQTSDTVCVYTPQDGNISGVGVAAYRSMGASTDLNIVSNTKGVIGNQITVSLLTHEGIEKGSEFILVDGYNINVYINTTATIASSLSDISTAINAHTLASSLVSSSVTPGSELLEQTAAETKNLTGGTDGLDLFTYTVSDGVNSSIGTVIINLTNTNDPPSVCSYSSYHQAPECGPSDCISISTPVGRVIPSKTDLYYYDQTSAICYKSTGVSSNNDWEVITGNGNEIPAKIVGQNTSITFNRMRIDEGGGYHISSSEDTQTLELISITSSNTLLIPENENNIVLKYNDIVLGLNSVGAFPATPNFGNAGNEDALPLRLEIFPQTGLAGVSTITLGFSDSLGATTSLDFVITVDSTSVIHGGWTNIAANGPMVNKFDDVVEGIKACSYNIDKCNTNQSCTGVLDPNSSGVTPDVTGAIFYRSDTGECFKAGAIDWEVLDTYCPISSSQEETGCAGLGANCIGMGTPSISSSKIGSTYYDETDKLCYKSTSTNGVHWEVYKAPGSASFSWNAFTILGGATFKGHNIFRRNASETFDYENPINKNILSTTDLEYEDNTANSITAPLPGAVYYYEVRPVVESGTPTSEFAVGSNVAFNILRILVPGNNKSFVHRWMVNKSTCEKMHATDIDGTNNFRCTYSGPGDYKDPVTNIHYFDYQNDLIVDRFEAGCRYSYASEAQNCGGSTFDGSCIGILDPNSASVIPNPVGTSPVYYERGTGSCWKYDNGGSSWVKSTSYEIGYNYSELPPLVNISQQEAATFCGSETMTGIIGVCQFTRNSCLGGTSDCNTSSTGVDNPDTIITGTSGDVFLSENKNLCYVNTDGATAWTRVYEASFLYGRLPNRKHQIAYSDWNTSKYSDSQITNLEAGVSLNSSSKCNSFNASGLDNHYSDSASPDVNTLFTIPGTATSGIRSFMTGSSTTRSCQSRYGVQDAVGNVAEWTTDRFDCSKEFGRECAAVSSGQDPNGLQLVGITDNFMETTDGNLTSSYDIFRIGYNSVFPMLIGPCQTDDGTRCTDFTESWVLDTSGPNALARRFILPLGLPAATAFNINTAGLETDPVAQSLLEIGSGLGISTSALHGDKVNFNTEKIALETAIAPLAYCGAMSSGGGYTSITGGDAGVYSMEMTPCTDIDGADSFDPTDTVDDSKRVDIGFRCVIEVDPANYIE